MKLIDFDIIKRAKRVFKNRRRYETLGSSIDNQINIVKEDVSKAVHRYIDAEVHNSLKKIPVDAIKPIFPGAKIGVLTKNGYSTIADLIEFSSYALAGIYGISQESANKIYSAAKKIESDVRARAKISLSTDSRNPESDNLMRSLVMLSELKSNKQSYSEHFYEYENATEQYYKKIRRINSLFKWIFSSKNTKNECIYALDNYEAQNSVRGFETRFNDVENKFRSLSSIDTSTVKNSFQGDPIKYNMLLEDLVPELLSSDMDGGEMDPALKGSITSLDYDLAGFVGKLRRYQDFGTKYILHQKRVLLGDEMGLGKTLQAIAAIIALKNKGHTHFLVVCPLSVLENWAREIAKFTDCFTPIVAYGKNKENAYRLWADKGGICLTNFESTVKFVNLPKVDKGLVVVDEAHYIKNPGAKRTQNTLKLCMNSERVLFMTGTALENRIDEMINLLDFLQPDIIKKVRNYKYMMQVDPYNFRFQIAPVYYRRKQEDVLSELPELINKYEWCRMLTKERINYVGMVMAKTHFMTIRKLSWNMGDLEESSKATRLLEILRDAWEEKRKVVIFSFYREVLEKIQNLVGRNCAGRIDGSISASQRQEILDKFEKSDEEFVLVSQVVAGGVGVNIQCASVVVLCEPQIKPSIEMQAISRCYRMGQARSVLVYHLVCAGTIDERIINILNRKQKIFDNYADKSQAAEEIELSKKEQNSILSAEYESVLAEAS